jgi:hypothetical protein
MRQGLITNTSQPLCNQTLPSNRQRTLHDNPKPVSDTSPRAHYNLPILVCVHLSVVGNCLHLLDRESLEGLRGFNGHHDCVSVDHALEIATKDCLQVATRE